MSKLKAFFAVGLERRYLPRMLDTLIQMRPESVAAICVVCSPPRPDKPYGLREMMRARARYWRTRGFFLAAMEYFAYRWADQLSRKLGTKWMVSARNVARKHGIPYFESTRVNSDEFREMMKSVNANLLVSISAPSLFKKETLETPAYGAINIHNSLLPDYRGVMTVFWAMANGESEVGVTIHYMNEKFDEGPIISQERVPVNPGDTLHTLELKLRWDVGPRLLIQAMNDIEQGTVTTVPNPSGEGRYFGEPTKEAIERFRRQGRRVR